MRLSEAVYRIKDCRPAGSYSRKKRRVVHYNWLKPFNGACNQGQGWIAVETGPTSSKKPGNDVDESDLWGLLTSCSGSSILFLYRTLLKQKIRLEGLKEGRVKLSVRGTINWTFQVLF